MPASGVVLAEADGSNYYRVTGTAANDVLNMRSDADPSADKIDTIPPKADCLRSLYL